MKSIFKIFLLVSAIATVMVACDKVGELPHYSNGSAVTLSASATAAAPLAADSNKTALTLTWTDPKYATDASHVKYTIEIDSTGKNFANAATRVVVAALKDTITAKELNNILLAKGYAFN